jgi:hypothetical protein
MKMHRADRLCDERYGRSSGRLVRDDRHRLTGCESLTGERLCGSSRPPAARTFRLNR